MNVKDVTQIKPTMEAVKGKSTFGTATWSFNEAGVSFNEAGYTFGGRDEAQGLPPSMQEVQKLKVGQTEIKNL